MDCAIYRSIRGPLQVPHGRWHALYKHKLNV